MSSCHNIDSRSPVKDADTPPTKVQESCTEVLIETGKYAKFDLELFDAAIRVTWIFCFQIDFHVGIISNER